MRGRPIPPPGGSRALVAAVIAAAVVLPAPEAAAPAGSGRPPAAATADLGPPWAGAGGRHALRAQDAAPSPGGSPPCGSPDPASGSVDDVRREAYRSVFGGAVGRTPAMWQFLENGDPAQVRHLRALLESRP